MGLSWAHVVGDAFSAFNFITKWSQSLAGETLKKSLHMSNFDQHQFPQNSFSKKPASIKSATVVGEYWLNTNNNNNDVVTHSFHITSKQLQHLLTTTLNQTNVATETKTKTSYFEILSALVWKSIAKIRENLGTNVVTVCTSVTNRAENEFPTNDLVLSKVETEFPAGEFDISELVKLIAEKKMNENFALETFVEGGEGKGDFIVYGAKLTFVDLEEAELYGIKINEKEPIIANCDFRGVGDQGVVLILPAPKDNEGDSNGRMITVSLPGKELERLENELGSEWGIHSSSPAF